MAKAKEENAARRDYIQLDFQRTDISFALKSYTPLVYRHSRGRSAQLVKDAVLKEPRLEQLIAEIAEEDNVEVKVVQQEVKRLLDEIGHKQYLPAVRVIALILRGPIRRVIRAIHVKSDGLEQLRAAVQQWPVLLLPTHRSYLDFILITYLLLEHDIQVPYIAAGQDFMQMKLVNKMLRRAGAFYMRRTFGTDQLYKLLFTEYMKYLLCSSGGPIEFYIEGTRSRTAKSLHPKLGLLSMAMEPYLNGSLPDILMFPISISYERTLEEELFSWELLGQPKPRESTRGLMKALAILKEDYGSIFINISSPISLHEYCQQHGISRVPHGLSPRDEFTLSSAERGMITDLGYTLLHQLEQNMVHYPSSLVATLMLCLCQTGRGYTGIPRDELMRQTVWLKKEVEMRGGLMDWIGDTDSVMSSTLGLLSSCLEEASGRVRVVRPMPAEPQSEDGRVMLDGAVHLKLAHYRNKIIHLFVPEAMLVMTLQQFKSTSKTQAQVLFGFLHTALSREFVLPHNVPSQELFQSTLHQLTDRGVVLVEEGGALVLNERQQWMVDVLSHIIRPFVAGVWVMCVQLLSLRGGVQTLKATYKEAQKSVLRQIKGDMLCSYEPLSHEMLRNAMGSLNQQGFIMELELELEGRDRLVKVAQQDRLQELTQQLSGILFPNGTGKLTTPSIQAKL